MPLNSDDAAGNSANETVESKVDGQKKLVEQLKKQWKLLWDERFDDRIRAEGVSASDYESLRVERGTIIHATRDFKPLNFKDILNEHKVENPERFIPPNKNLGGWNKFVKTQITDQKKGRAKPAEPEIKNNKKSTNQPKKGGRGWLHAK